MQEEEDKDDINRGKYNSEKNTGGAHPYDLTGSHIPQRSIIDLTHDLGSGVSRTFGGYIQSTAV